MRPLAPVPAAVPDPLRDRLQTSLGATYTLDRELGGGGMSRAFVAHDETLGRDVVVKVLAPDLAEGLSAERFTREVRTAARLQHPNIVPVLAAGTLGPAGAGASAGLPYYTMPFIAGASLRVRLAEGPLPLGEALTVLKDVLRALACAHAAGVVHRDIKPENVLLTGGAAVVADFGIAKALSAAGSGSATLTQLGMAVGTPAYMAPEQAAGEADVDHRADLYAWGLLAWEVLAGRHPFSGKTGALALLGAHLTEIPASLASVRAEVSPVLAVLVARCLAKGPAERPADAAAVLRALDQVSLTPRESLPATAGERVSGAARTATPVRTLAVLPMVNTSGDPESEHFSDGLTDELIGALSTVPSLRVTGRTSSFALKGKGLAIADVARTLGVDRVLEGSVQRAGPRMKARLQLVRADGSVLWAEAFDRTLLDVFEVQEEIARAVVGALRVTLGAGQGSIVRPPTADLVAHDLYLKGRAAVRGGHPDDLRRAIGLFEQAVARDPSFAAAYAARALAYVFLPIASDLPSREVAAQARAAATRALALDDGLAAAHQAMGHVCYSADLDVPGAMRHIRRALDLDPGNPDAHQLAAVVLHGQRHFVDAEAHAQRALAADPLHPFMHFSLGWVYLVSGRAAQGLPYLERTVEVAPNFTLAHEILVHAYLVLGRHPEALAQCRRGLAVGGRRERAMLAYVHAVQGRHAEARAVLAELETPSALPHAPPCHMVYAYANLGEVDTAIRWLERAFDERDPHLNGLATIPAYEPLRADPRFQAFLARLRHEPPPDGEPAWAPVGVRAASPHRPDRSLVVLPFANLSPDPDTSYFSDGLAEELIADLSRVKALRIISRATAMALKNTAESIPTICHQLGARYALSGSVRRAGPSLRVTVQLVDATTDAPVWADKYAGTLDDVFDLQERLSREIVDALAVALTPEESARLARRPFDDVRVFECYLRARDELWHFAPSALDRVRDLIARGRALGGDHSRFLELEGQLLVQLHNFGVDTDPARLTEAAAIADRLLAAEDTRAEGHAVLASVRWRQHRLRDAVRHGREAFALDPTQTGAGFLAGALAVNDGDLAGARRDHAALAEVDPWGPMTSLVEAAIAWHAGNGAAAVAAMEQATGRWPDDGFMPWFHALALSYAGREVESAALMDRIAVIGRGTWVEHSASAYACALRGDADGVRRWTAPAWYLDFITLDEMKPLPVAEAYARIGDADRALELLAVVVRNGFTDEAFLARHDPMLAPLRGDPRFQRLLEACHASNAG